MRRRTIQKDGGGDKRILEHDGSCPDADTESDYGDSKVEWSRVAYHHPSLSDSPVGCDAGWKEEHEGITIVNPKDILKLSTEPDEDVLLELLFKVYSYYHSICTLTRFLFIAYTIIN